MTASETVAPTVTFPQPAAALDAGSASPGGAFGRLLRFAVANLRRRPERFVLAVVGIGLAIAAVTVVRTISTGFAMTGAASVERVVGGAAVWVVPAAGVHYDSEADALVPDGTPSNLAAPAGWTLTRTAAGVWDSPEGDVAVYSRDGLAAGQARAGAPLADRLGLHDGDRLDLGRATVTVRIDGSSPVLSVAPATARDVVGGTGWWTATEPASDSARNDLGRVFGTATGLPSTTDATRTPEKGGDGLVYDTSGSHGTLTFAQRYAALFAGQVTGSTLGLVSVIGLVLGFVIAVSSFLASVQERRREFGIMSSIGLADEVLYFFLVESGLVFVASWVLGVTVGGLAVWLVVPSLVTPVAWAQAAALVAAFMPAMAIVGALVPVHRLLQQRPVALLADQ